MLGFGFFGKYNYIKIYFIFDFEKKLWIYVWW